MSSNLDNKISQIKELVDHYKDLDESDKINEAIKLKKEIRGCKKIILNYQDIVENTDAHLSETPADVDTMTEETFKFNMEQLNKIRTTIESNPNLTIDEKVSLFIDYTKYSNMVKEYLDQKREMVVKYI